MQAFIQIFYIFRVPGRGLTYINRQNRRPPNKLLDIKMKNTIQL